MNIVDSAGLDKRQEPEVVEEVSESVSENVNEVENLTELELPVETVEETTEETTVSESVELNLDEESTLAQKIEKDLPHKLFEEDCLTEPVECEEIPVEMLKKFDDDKPADKRGFFARLFGRKHQEIDGKPAPEKLKEESGGISSTAPNPPIGVVEPFGEKDSASHSNVEAVQTPIDPLYPLQEEKIITARIQYYYNTRKVIVAKAGTARALFLEEEMEYLQKEIFDIYKSENISPKERWEMISPINERIIAVEKELDLGNLAEQRQVEKWLGKNGNYDLRSGSQNAAETVLDPEQQAVVAPKHILPKPKASAPINWAMVLLTSLTIVAILVAGYAFLNSNTGNGKAYVEIASLYLSSGKAKEAEAALDQAVQMGIDNEDWGTVGSLYLQLKKNDKAVNALQKAINYDPNNPTYRLSYAQANTGIKAYSEAMGQYEQLLAQEPNSYDYNLQYAKFSASQNDFLKVAELCENLVTIDGTYKAYNQCGDIYLDSKRWTDAVNQYNKAIELGTKTAWSYANLGLAYEKLSQYYEAQAAERSAINMDPKLKTAYVRLGDYAKLAGELDNAIDAYQSAIKEFPDDVTFYVSLGQVLSSQGKCEDALKKFDQALKLDPKNTAAQEGVASCNPGE